jgi:hypothetical protein
LARSGQKGAGRTRRPSPLGTALTQSALLDPREQYCTCITQCFLLVAVCVFARVAEQVRDVLNRTTIESGSQARVRPG